jgi:hypothetical protein
MSEKICLPCVAASAKKGVISEVVSIASLCVLVLKICEAPSLSFALQN